MDLSSKQIKESKYIISRREEFKEGCEVFEAIKAIGKMIVLYYSTKEE